MKKKEFQYWLSKDPRLLIGNRGDLASFDVNLKKPVLEHDPYSDEYFVKPDAEKSAAYQYYLEYIGKSIFEDDRCEGAIGSAALSDRGVPDVKETLELFSTGIQKNDAYSELLFKIFSGSSQWKRTIKINECNTRFSVRSCSVNPLEKGHSVHRHGNSCNDKLCPRCARKINFRETKKAMKKFGCTGSTFISFEFTVPRDLWEKIDHHKGTHKPGKIRCGKCGADTEINDKRVGKDHDIRSCIRRGCGWIGHKDDCIGDFFKLEDSGINKLCKAVNRTLKRFHGGQIGGFMAIHTFSSTSLSWKPHIHVLITDKVIVNKDPLQMKRIKKWAEKSELDELHRIYTEEINKTFGTDYPNVVCDRHYLDNKHKCPECRTNTMIHVNQRADEMYNRKCPKCGWMGYAEKNQLKHRLRYMNRLPAQFIYEDESGLYYNDKFKGLDRKVSCDGLFLPKDEIDGLEALDKSVRDHIKKNGMYDRLMKYGAEGESIIDDYVDAVVNAMGSGAGKVYLYDAKKDQLMIENLLFFEMMIDHFWKRSAHNYRWIGWLSNSTWQYWVKKFKMPYKPYEHEEKFCKCGAALMSIGVMDESGWRWIIPELLDIMPDLLTIHYASDHDCEEEAIES